MKRAVGPAVAVAIAVVVVGCGSSAELSTADAERAFAAVGVPGPWLNEAWDSPWGHIVLQTRDAPRGQLSVFVFKDSEAARREENNLVPALLGIAKELGPSLGHQPDSYRPVARRVMNLVIVYDESRVSLARTVERAIARLQDSS